MGEAVLLEAENGEGMHGCNKGTQTEFSNETGDKVTPNIPYGSDIWGKHTGSQSDEEEVSDVGRVM